MDVTREKLGFQQSLGALPKDVPHSYKVAELTCTGQATYYNMELHFPCVVRMDTLKRRERKAIEELAQKGNKRKTAEQIIESVLRELQYSGMTVTQSMFDPYIGPAQKCFDTTYTIDPDYTTIEMDLRAAVGLTFDGDAYAENEEIGDFICYFPTGVRLHRWYEFNKHCCEVEPEWIPHPEDYFEFDKDDARKALQKKVKETGTKPRTGPRFRFVTPRPMKKLPD